jgi:hypothetical protein
MRQKTYMAQQYKYYVYVRPGCIEYFNDLHEAQEFARDYDAEVKEMDI